MAQSLAQDCREIKGCEVMIKFSWYTIPKKITKLITVYQYAVDRFLPVSVDKNGFSRYIHIKQGVFVFDEDGGWTKCKPNMKGGHTHNYARNAIERKLNKSKSSRKRCHNHLNKRYEYKFIAKRCLRRVK